jgi:hypothetical protein
MWKCIVKRRRFDVQSMGGAKFTLFGELKVTSEKISGLNLEI